MGLKESLDSSSSQVGPTKLLFGIFAIFSPSVRMNCGICQHENISLILLFLNNTLQVNYNLTTATYFESKMTECFQVLHVSHR